MTKENAFKLFGMYVTGWLENDIEKILLPLAENCTVVESHGPTYLGFKDIKKWVELWREGESKVEYWNILASYHCQDGVSVFEWDFSCVSHQKRYAFPGITVAKFYQEKIILLHEYRMTHSPYKWDQLKLRLD